MEFVTHRSETPEGITMQVHTTKKNLPEEILVIGLLRSKEGNTTRLKMFSFKNFKECLHHLNCIAENTDYMYEEFNFEVVAVKSVAGGAMNYEEFVKVANNIIKNKRIKYLKQLSMDRYL